MKIKCYDEFIDEVYWVNCEKGKELPDYVYVEDEPLYRAMWLTGAKDRNMKLACYANGELFLNDADLFLEKEIKYFFDHDLGEDHMNGIEVAMTARTHLIGARSLVTAHSKSDFLKAIKLDIIKEVFDKMEGLRFFLSHAK